MLANKKFTDEWNDREQFDDFGVWLDATFTPMTGMVVYYKLPNTDISTRFEVADHDAEKFLFTYVRLIRGVERPILTDERITVGKEELVNTTIDWGCDHTLRIALVEYLNRFPSLMDVELTMHDLNTQLRWAASSNTPLRLPRVGTLKRSFSIVMTLAVDGGRSELVLGARSLLYLFWQVRECLEPGKY